jgi:hypothetical protein
VEGSKVWDSIGEKRYLAGHMGSSLDKALKTISEKSSLDTYGSHLTLLSKTHCSMQDSADREIADPVAVSQAEAEGG